MGPILESLYGIHVLLACFEILTVAHINIRTPHSGSKTQDKEDSRNYGSWDLNAYVVFRVTHSMSGCFVLRAF